MFLSAVPIVVFTLKLNFSKKALHIDTDRYEQVNLVCFDEKNPTTCEQFLREDLEILLNAHKKNKVLLDSHISVLHPQKLAKIMYVEQENSSVIEPEIVLKSLMIRKILFKDMSNPIKAGIFAEEIETYISKSFSAQNKSVSLKAFASQNQDFEKYAKKIKYRKKSKRPAEKKKSTEHFDSYDY